LEQWGPTRWRLQVGRMPVGASRSPILHAQTGHAREFARIAGYQDHIARHRLTGDQDVIRTDHAPPGGEERANLAGAPCVFASFSNAITAFASRRKRIS
jgi:hypothetical protein